jgi:hypothetical protein
MSEIAESSPLSRDRPLPPDPTRDDVAGWYARTYMDGDPRVAEVVYLPEGSPDWEIRMVLIDTKFKYPPTDELEPLDWSSPLAGVPPHTVLVCDTSVDRWREVLAGRMKLPSGWSPRNAVHFENAEAGR